MRSEDQEEDGEKKAGCHAASVRNCPGRGFVHLKCAEKYFEIPEVIGTFERCGGPR